MLIGILTGTLTFHFNGIIFRETHVAALRVAWSARPRPGMVSALISAGIRSQKYPRGLQGRVNFRIHEGNPTCCGGCPQNCKDAARLDNGHCERSCVMHFTFAQERSYRA